MRLWGHKHEWETVQRKVMDWEEVDNSVVCVGGEGARWNLSNVTAFKAFGYVVYVKKCKVCGKQKSDWGFNEEAV
jgi:hypothetical protein